MVPHCFFPSWLAPEYPAASWKVARSFERPPQQQESSSPASTRYYHVVTEPWKQPRRRPCPERWQSRAQGRRAYGNRRHPIDGMVSKRKVSEGVGKTYSEGTSTPGATTVNLVQVAQLAEDGLVAQRNVDEAVVSESAHRGKGSGLLTTTLSTGRHEETGVLAPEATSGPDATGLVPEGLPLSREVTVTRRDTEQNSIEGEEVGGLHNGVVSLGRSVHLAQDFLAEGLGDPRDSNVNQMA